MSKRSLTSSMPSMMRSNFVLLSITYSGVMILPISCIQPAIESSFSSTSVKETSLSAPVLHSFILAAMISVSSATRVMWAELYLLFFSIADAIERINCMRRFSKLSMSLRFESAIAACEAREVSIALCSSLKVTISLSPSMALMNWITPRTVSSWSLSGMVSIDLQR